MTYIITNTEDFHDAAVEFTLAAARKTKKSLIKFEEHEAIQIQDDCPPTDYRIYKLVLVE